MIQQWARKQCGPVGHHCISVNGSGGRERSGVEKHVYPSTVLDDRKIRRLQNSFLPPVAQLNVCDDGFKLILTLTFNANFYVRKSKMGNNNLHLALANKNTSRDECLKSNDVVFVECVIVIQNVMLTKGGECSEQVAINK